MVYTLTKCVSMRQGNILGLLGDLMFKLWATSS